MKVASCLQIIMTYDLGKPSTQKMLGILGFLRKLNKDPHKYQTFYPLLHFKRCETSLKQGLTFVKIYILFKASLIERSNDPFSYKTQYEIV